VDEAKKALMDALDLSEVQTKAILEMRLQKLVSLEMDKIKEEFEELMKKIEYLKSILASEELQKTIAKDELLEVKEKYGDKRRTEISFAEGEISIEDMIPNEEVVITISHKGYIKRTKTSEYKIQGRGGVGARGSKTRDEDFIEHMFIATNHNYLLLFTEKGRCHWLRVYQIPEVGKGSLGRVIQNIIALPKDDKVKAYIKIEDLTDDEFINNNYIVFATRKGNIKKTRVEAFSRPRVNGINAITINEGDTLLEALLSDGSDDVMLANQNGRAIRFPESKVRSMGRSAAGVRGMRLDGGNDQIVGMVISRSGVEEESVFVISENGYGKRSAVEEYRMTNRGGKGVKTMQITDKTGKVIAIKIVKDDNDIMVSNKSGIVIRIKGSGIRVMGRATQGVRVIKLIKGDSISDVAIIPPSDDSDEEE
jgi:DNA gyrase subunit A